jgi:Tol biopolymer transport system component
VNTGPPGGGPSQAKVFPIVGRVASVEVKAPQTILWVGQRVQLTATPLDGSGNQLPQRTTQWSSGNPEVITVNGAGVITPLREGFADIHAVIDGKSASEGIYVFAAPNYDLMYDSNRGTGGRELWILSLGVDSVPRRWLPEGVLGEDAATSPDGTRIAFVCRDQYLNSDICVANRDGSGLTRLTTHGGSDDNPAWSRDGTQIAFRSTRAPHGQSQIWIMNADGSNQRNLMGDSFSFVDGAQSKPTFGTNGRIYFQMFFPLDGRSVLGSLPVNGTWQEMVLHTPAGFSDSDPAVSWDGSKIMVRRKQGGTDYGLQYVDYNGNPVFAINYPGPGFGPSWSRNDQWIAYSHSIVGDQAVDVFVTRQNEVWRKRITIGAAVGGGRNPIFIKR